MTLDALQLSYGAGNVKIIVVLLGFSQNSALLNSGVLQHLQLRYETYTTNSVYIYANEAYEQNH